MRVFVILTFWEEGHYAVFKSLVNIYGFLAALIPLARVEISNFDIITLKRVLIPACVVTAIVTYFQDVPPTECLYFLSFVLDTIATFCQTFSIYKYQKEYGKIDNLCLNFIFALGFEKSCVSIKHLIFPHRYDLFFKLNALVELVLYGDFVYYHLVHKVKEDKKNPPKPKKENLQLGAAFFASLHFLAAVQQNFPTRRSW